MMLKCDGCDAEVDADAVTERVDLPTVFKGGVAKAQSVVLWPGAIMCGSCGMELAVVEEGVESGD